MVPNAVVSFSGTKPTRFLGFIGMYAFALGWAGLNPFWGGGGGVPSRWVGRWVSRGWLGPRRSASNGLVVVCMLMFVQG